MKNNILMAGVVSLLSFGAGFAGGYKYRDTRQVFVQTAPDGTRQFGGRNIDRGSINPMQGRAVFRPIIGEIIEVSDKSIKVKVDDKTSKLIIISEDTSISTSLKVDQKELKTGIKVSVFGQENPDGTTVATIVQLSPDDDARMNTPPQKLN